MLFPSACFVQSGAKATVSCLLGTKRIFIPGLCANQGVHSYRGPTIENGTKQQSRSTCCHLVLPMDSTSICLFNFLKGFTQ